MTNLNGLFILGIVLVAAIYTWLGYSWGRLDERKKGLKDLIEVNKQLNEALNEKWRCGECGEIRMEDDRVANGMKCGQCAYGI